MSSRLSRCCLAALPFAFSLALSESASALPLISVSASLRGLYGSFLGDGDIYPNPYGFGLGARAGVTLPMSLYLGGSADLFFGDSERIGGGEISSSLFQVMGNVGYDLGLGPLTLRPFLGLGLASGSTELCTGSDCESNTESDFVAAPGAEAFIGLGLLALTAEVRYNKIFTDPNADGFVLGVGLGLSF